MILFIYDYDACFNRKIILRRFFALSGTIFLLRSITMLVTSLSVSKYGMIYFMKTVSDQFEYLFVTIYLKYFIDTIVN